MKKIINPFSQCFRLICLFFVSCLLSFPVLAAQLFSGQWSAESDSQDGTPLSTLSLNLVQQGQNLTGTYCYVTQRGARIDCPEQGVENLHGIVNSESATVVFDSSFGGEKGKAELTLNDGKLSWSLLAEPQGGEFYAPKTYQLDKSQQVLVGKKTAVASNTQETNADSDELVILTKTYKISIDQNCQEGEVSCDNVTYHSLNKKNNKEITLKGKVINQKPSMDFAGYEFDNGDYAYTLTPDYSASDSQYEYWMLNVFKGNKVVFSEAGKSSIK